MAYTSINASKSGIVNESRKLSNKILDYSKSMATATHKVSLPKKSNRNRLMGGADVPEEPKKPEEEKSKEHTDLLEPISESLTVLSSPPVPTTPPSSLAEQSVQIGVISQEESLHSASRPSLDRKIDEIIDYVRQNLDEAGKALATLGMNFEHDIKLMFVDILGRIQHWSGIVQNKLDICQNEIKYLRRELLARAYEIDVKTREMADLKAQIAEYENAKAIYESLATDAKIQEVRRDKDILRERHKVIESEQINHVSSINGEYEEAVASVDYVSVAIQNGIENKDEGKNIRRHSENEGKKIGRDSEDEGKKIRRDSELESEVIHLRKENDRIMKERAEYENAVQRALLRGVSSLNAEALRVLHCPPCCTPIHCPAMTNIPCEINVPCPGKNVKRHSGTANATVCNVRLPYTENVKNGDHDYCTTRRANANLYCSTSRNRKSPNDTMIFLLRQGDSENPCVPQEDVSSNSCKSPIIKKIEIPSHSKYRR